jgi:hypothetical protein
MFFDHRDPPQVVMFPWVQAALMGHMVPLDEEPTREPLKAYLATFNVARSASHLLTVRADAAPDLTVDVGSVIDYGGRRWCVLGGYDPWETVDHVDYEGLRTELARMHQGKPNAARLVDEGVRSRREHHQRQRGKWLKLLVTEAKNAGDP